MRPVAWQRMLTTARSFIMAAGISVSFYVSDSRSSLTLTHTIKVNSRQRIVAKALIVSLTEVKLVGQRSLPGFNPVSFVTTTISLRH